MSQFADYFWCAEMNTLLDSVRAAGRQVSALARSGASDATDLIGLDPRLDRATTWIDRHSSVFGAPLFGESCKNAVAEGRDVLQGLNDIIREFSGTPIVDDRTLPVVGEEGSPTDVLKQAKTIVVAIGVIAGAVLLFPIVMEAVGARRAARAVSGYRRRRRR